MKEGIIGDMAVLGVTESFQVKRQVLLSAAEAAEMILRVDDIIKAAPRYDVRICTGQLRWCRVTSFCGRATMQKSCLLKILYLKRRLTSDVLMFLLHGVFLHYEYERAFRAISTLKLVCLSNA